MREEYLRLFCSNVRGLVCNWDAATSFDWNNYDVVAFNEIWNIKDFENLNVENFEVKTVKLRNIRRGGGSIIFGRKNLQCEVLNPPFREGCIETSGIKINGVNFINIYRPPSGDRDVFFDLLGEYIETLGNSKILIGGDFNINLFTELQIIENFGLHYGVAHKISSVTRIISSSCIDNFLSNVDSYLDMWIKDGEIRLYF